MTCRTEEPALKLQCLLDISKQNKTKHQQYNVLEGRSVGTENRSNPKYDPNILIFNQFD